MTKIQVREITGTDLVPLTFRLRYEVYSEETTLNSQSRLQGMMTDSHDKHARHWAAFEGIDLHLLFLLLLVGRMFSAKSYSTWRTMPLMSCRTTISSASNALKLARSAFGE